MKTLACVYLLVVIQFTSSLLLPHAQQRRSNHHAFSRRTFVQTLVGTTLATTTVLPKAALAISMVTTDEFSTILRDSARGIVRVEFSGPQNENVQVLLADGTRFGLSDVTESSTDPRSPLKIAALCRENGVATKFVDLEAALSSVPKRKKAYTNVRVQEAAAKEREKQERIEKDEQDRLAALREMEAREKEGAAESL